ncbi:anti-sigma-D factor RsdA [Amycolatopsis cihanbeyliensis]|uniref:Anti-sigma-D factor RsdA-like protein n=1 Tax=Amycolatopsis cihanbeyliensis TaxID=1128664 RepID=A0A542DJ58_AMYCI|nr:anti-sigma-D factor RsdA [Amycolatopsis cihanbeyliensis]TQJ03100.1 anti-sigma-D factor RsdA-like protein [Amycolatopsis cihanbeyliensis]
MTERENGREHDEREPAAARDVERSEPEESGRPSPQDIPDIPDITATQADDALLDALGGSDPKVADGLGDQELNALLLAWRRDIDSEPLAELVDTETAVRTVQTAALAKRNGSGGRRRRFLIPVAAAAAVLAIAFTGTGLAARDAQPGDMLWGLTQVLYADQAKSIEAAATVRLELDEAQAAITAGRYEEARQKLEEARRALEQVSTSEDREKLNAAHHALSLQLNDPQGGSGDNQSDPPQRTGQSKDKEPSNSQPGSSDGPPTSSQLDPRTSTQQPSSSTSLPPSTTSTPSGEGTGSEPGSSPRFDTSGEAKEPQDQPAN